MPSHRHRCERAFYSPAGRTGGVSPPCYLLAVTRDFGRPRFGTDARGDAVRRRRARLSRITRRKTSIWLRNEEGVGWPTRAPTWSASFRRQDLPGRFSGPGRLRSSTSPPAGDCPRPSSADPEDSACGQPDHGIHGSRPVVQRAVVNSDDDGLMPGKGRAEEFPTRRHRPSGWAAARSSLKVRAAALSGHRVPAKRPPWRSHTRSSSRQAANSATSQQGSRPGCQRG